MSAGTNKAVSRRGFLKSMLGAGGALVVGVELVPGLSWTNAAAAVATAGGSLGVYVTIGADETVTLTYPGAEMGQGASTGLAQILAEELMVDWSSVRLLLGGYDPQLNRPTNGTTLGTSQSTGGSNSVRGYHDYLRNVGATARQKLIWAANSLNPSIPVSDLKAVNGTVVRISDGSLVATYGALAATAVTMTPNDVAWVQPPYRIIGQSVPRLDLPSKVNGSAVYGIDIRLPGMLYASVKQAPKVGQTVGTIGAAPSGVLAVVPVPAASRPVVSGTLPPIGGVGVVTNSTTWGAIQAARSIAVTWVDEAYTANLDTALMKTRAAGLMSSGTAVTASPKVGDADAALVAAPANQRYSGTYSVPYLAHATMEPMNATVLVTDASCEIWAPTQVQTRAAEAAALVTGLPLSAIKVNTTYLGGGNGRRLQVDFIIQAVTIAKAMKGTPIKTVWSREDDFTHDYFRPASLTKIDAAVDGSGAITAIKARVVCPSSKYQTGTLTSGTVDSSAVDGLVNALYNFPNKTVEWVLDTIEVPLGSWRSVGNSQNCFFLESLLDEVAIGTNQDPIALRRSLLNSGTPTHLRALAVLDALVTASNWNTAPVSGRARGMAMSMSFGDTIVGEVAEVSGSVASGFKVHNVTVVIDCGLAVNPGMVKAQIESAVDQGLAAAMWQGQTFVTGTPQKRNFDTYRMARLREAPAINTVIIDSGAKIGGVGEPGLPPIAPAIANAIARLTGIRARNLPLSTMPVPPVISSFTPSSGPVGTVVTLTGTGFTGATAVTFNGVTATSFTVTSATQLVATVPAGATTGKIAVTTADGTGTSANSYSVTTGIPLPYLASFTPASGPAGTLVTINGSNLTGTTAVKFNGATAAFTVVSATQLTATVPAGATTGTIAVTNPGGTTTTTASFTVGLNPLAPTVSGFSPTSGAVGSTVTITGSKFTGTTAVRFNGVAATVFTVVSDTQVTATVPVGATSGKISVTNASGTGTSSSSYTVTVPVPTVSSFTPTSGPIGTVVTINGTNFAGVTAVKFNGKTATSFTVVSATQISATVPTGTTTGKVSVTNSGGTGTSSASFTVTSGSTAGAPTISSFTPSSGGAGTSVTLTGTNFTGTTSVKFNGTAATFTVVSSTKITTTVPAGAPKGSISVTNPYGTVTSRDAYDTGIG